MKAGLPFLVFVLVATPLLAQGTIQGKIIDRSGGSLPGVTIRITTADSQRTVITDSSGTYRLTDLTPGRYAVRATLAGFCAAAKDDVSVVAGQVSDVSFTLMVAGLADVLWVTLNAPDDFRNADAVVQLRIEDVTGAKSWETSPCTTLTTPEYRATILAVAKSHPNLTPASFTFLNGHMNYGEPGYAKGDEFVAFLNWDDAAGAFVRKGGPPRMLPVRGGRVDVRWERAVESMKVEDFLATLRALPNPPRFQMVEKIEGRIPVYYTADVSWASYEPVPLADVYARVDAIVHLRITRTLPSKPFGADRQLCTEHEVTVLEVLKTHPIGGPTEGKPFVVLQESAGEWEGFKGLATYPEGTELVAFLAWRPSANRLALERDVLAVRDGRVVRLLGERVIREDASGRPLFKDVPSGIPVKDLLANLRTLAKIERRQ